MAASTASDEAAKADLAGLRVVVVGTNYAPELTGIGPYTTGLAEHLAAQGADVAVVTCMPHYPSWTIPDEYRGKLSTRARVNGVELLRLRTSMPRTMTASQRALHEGTFLAHAAARTALGRPDVIIGVSPALGGAVAAALMAKRTGAPFVIVVQDLVAKATGQSGITGGGRAGLLASKLEGWSLRSADQVLVVAEAFRPDVQAYGVDPHRIGVMRNWTHIVSSELSRDEARRCLDWPIGDFLAVHTGNMGFKQDLGNVVNAARALEPGERTRVLLVGDGSMRRELESYAEGVDALSFVDPVDADTYPVVLAAADVLVINERPSVAEMSLPSKLTSYFAAHRAVVAAVAEGGATSRELALSNAARIVPAGDPTALVDAIRELRQDTQQRGILADAGLAFATQRLSAEASLSVLRRAICDLAGRSESIHRSTRREIL